MKSLGEEKKEQLREKAEFVVIAQQTLCSFIQMVLKLLRKMDIPSNSSECYGTTFWAFQRSLRMCFSAKVMDSFAAQMSWQYMRGKNWGNTKVRYEFKSSY